MCRFLGYIGPRIELQGLLYEPPFGLERQSWAPRRQQHGNVNADGWGVGWYDLGVRPEPVRYRTPMPMWSDRNFAELAPVLFSDCVVAAVRDATEGMPVDQTSTAPFRAGRFLFAHNGCIDGFRTGIGTELRRSLTPEREAQVLGGSDSEVAFAMLLDRLDQGLTPADALRETIADIRSITTGRFNFIVTDGEELVATRSGDTLFASSAGAAEGVVTLIASEPLDDDLDWTEVPDEFLVIATRDSVPDLQPV